MSQILTLKQLINLKYEKIEDDKRISKLGWGEHKDVLYSFIGIFTLGIYIFEKENGDKNRYSIGRDNIIRIAGKHQRLYSRKYIIAHLDDFSNLVNTNEIRDFVRVYTTVGNIIPIWPGGNEFKGKAGCYDIPDIFFYQYRDMEKVYVQHILNKSIEDVALTRFMSGSPYVSDIQNVFEYDMEEYKKFVVHIINEIETRTKEIEKLF